jgi:glc operon protein GlcG
MTALTSTAQVLLLAGADAVIASAKAEAARRGVAVTIAVVDRAGHLVALARMDGIHVGTVAVATAKAKGAALYNRPTSVFATGLAGGSTALLSLPDLVAFPGGVPLLAAGTPVGAVGISGAAPDVDEAIANAGAASLAAA